VACGNTKQVQIAQYNRWASYSRSGYSTTGISDRPLKILRKSTVPISVPQHGFVFVVLWTLWHDHHCAFFILHPQTWKFIEFPNPRPLSHAANGGSRSDALWPNQGIGHASSGMLRRTSLNFGEDSKVRGRRNSDSEELPVTAAASSTV
jgi:hypothetical protein